MLSTKNSTRYMVSITYMFAAVTSRLTVALGHSDSKTCSERKT